MNTKILSLLFAGILISIAPIACMHEQADLDAQPKNRNKRDRNCDDISSLDHSLDELRQKQKNRKLKGEFDSSDELENIEFKITTNDELNANSIEKLQDNSLVVNQLITEGQKLLISLAQTPRMIQVQKTISGAEYTIFAQDGTCFTLGNRSCICLDAFEPGMQLHFPYTCNHPLTADEINELTAPALLVCPVCRAPQTEQQTLDIPKLELPMCDINKIPYKFLQFITTNVPSKYQREVFEQCTNQLMPPLQHIIDQINNIEEEDRLEQERIQTQALALAEEEEILKQAQQAHRKLITRPLKEIIEQSNNCDDYFKRADYLEQFKKLYKEFLSKSPEEIDYKGLIQAALFSKHGSQNFLITILIDLKNLPTQQEPFKLEDHPDLWLDLAESPYATGADSKLLIHFGLKPQSTL